MSIYFAAVHEHNSWRVHNKHESLQTATTGKDGAENLLRNIGRVGRDMCQRHGPVHAVLVWDDMALVATALRLVPGTSDKIERAKVPVSLLSFDKREGPSLVQ